MVPVGTEALQSFFFGLNLIWVDSDDAVAGNENLIRARRGRAGWRRKSRPIHVLSGIYETRDTVLAGREAQADANSKVFTNHETRNTNHGFFQTRGSKQGLLVLKPFSLFFGRGIV